MSPEPSYRDRRKRRLRVIAAVLAVCVAAQPVFVAYDALRHFGAGIIVLLLVAAVIVYVVVRRPRRGGS